MTARCPSRAEAVARGAKRYVSSKPCSKGHGFERYIGGKCIECNKVDVRERRHANRAHYRRLKVISELKLRYGLSVDQYLEMLARQHGVCAICSCELISGLDDSRAFGQGPRANIASVDHSHKTGQIRGLLCSNCNHALGKFRDDEKFLLSAVGYLRASATQQAQPTAERQSASEIEPAMGPRLERCRVSRRDELSPF